MPTNLLLNYVVSADVCLLLVALVFMFRSGSHRRMLAFTGFVGVTACQSILVLALMYHRKQLGVSVVTACKIFRISGWITEIAGTILLFLAVYSVFCSMMKPLPGLQRVGRLMFQWVGAVAVCLAAVVMFSPRAAGVSGFATLCGQFEEGTSILVLCLLLAVSVATRPLGLSVGSRSFGTLLGLGLLSASSLVESTWLATAADQSPYSPIHLIGLCGLFAGATTWAVYFAKAEPARRMITLPTTSPFFFWNRIAEALGDAPGEVAIAGFTPAMFAPAELLAFSSTPKRPAPVVEMPKVAQR